MYCLLVIRDLGERDFGGGEESNCKTGEDLRWRKGTCCLGCRSVTILEEKGYSLETRGCETTGKDLRALAESAPKGMREIRGRRGCKAGTG